MKHVLNVLAFNTCFNGSDVDENRHFIQGEVVAHRQILFLISIYEWKSYSKMKSLPNLFFFWDRRITVITTRSHMRPAHRHCDSDQI